MALRLNSRLYEASAVEAACKAFGIGMPGKSSGYYIIDATDKDAREFANYVLAMMKAKC